MRTRTPTSLPALSQNHGNHTGMNLPVRERRQPLPIKINLRLDVLFVTNQLINRIHYPVWKRLGVKNQQEQ